MLLLLGRYIISCMCVWLDLTTHTPLHVPYLCKTTRLFRLPECVQTLPETWDGVLKGCEDIQASLSLAALKDSLFWMCVRVRDCLPSCITFADHSRSYQRNHVEHPLVWSCRDRSAVRAKPNHRTVFSLQRTNIRNYKFCPQSLLKAVPSLDSQPYSNDEAMQVQMRMRRDTTRGSLPRVDHTRAARRPQVTVRMVRAAVG